MAFDPTTAQPMNFDAGSATEDDPVDQYIARFANKRPTTMSEVLIDRPKKGFADFVGSVAGAPGEALALANYYSQRLLGRNPEPPTTNFGVGGVSNAVRSLTGYRGVEPETQMQRLAGAAAEQLGAAAITAPAFASQVARPALGMAADAVSAVTGGVGSVLGGDISSKMGGGRAVGEFVGGLTGGIVGGAPLTLAAGRPVDGKAQALAGMDAAARERAGREILDALTADPKALDNMQDAAKVVETLRQLGVDFKPTIGARSNAPGVRSLEANVASSSPENLARYSTRAQENQAAVQQLRDLLFPQGGNMRASAQATTRQAANRYTTRLDQLDRQQQALAAQITPANQEQLGERLRALRDRAQDEARQVKNSLYQRVYDTANAAGLREDMTDVVSVAERIRAADENAFSRLPGEVRKVIARYMPEPAAPTIKETPTGKRIRLDNKEAPETPTASFEEMHSLWKALNRTSSQYLNSDPSVARLAEQLKAPLQAKLARFERENLGEVSQAFREANQFYAERYAPAFKTGTGGKMGRDGRLNAQGEMLVDEKVVKSFFTPSGVDDFFLIYQNNPDATRALRDGVLGMFEQAAVRDGRIDSGAAQKFLRQNRGTLDKLPEIRDTLTNAQTANASLAERAQRVQAAQRRFNETFLVQQAAVENPQQLIASVLKDPDNPKTGTRALLQTLSAIKDEDGKRAFLRGFAAALPEAAGKQEPLAFLMANEKAIKPILDRLGPDHFANLKVLAGADTIANRMGAPGTSRVPKMGSEVEEAIGTSMRGVATSMRELQTGRNSLVGVISYLGGRYKLKLDEQARQNLLREAIYNPEMAEALMKLSKQPKSTTLADKVFGMMRKAGITSENAGATLGSRAARSAALADEEE